MTLPVQLCLGAAAMMLLLAALHDLALRTVPNVMVALLGVVGLVLSAWQGRLLPSLGLTVLLLFLASLIWLRGYIGAGDAKLLAVAGLLVTPGNLPIMLLATATFGGLLCIPYLPGPILFSRPAPGRPVGMLRRILRCERWRLRRRGPLPYAVAIAVGIMFALMQGA